MNDAVASPTRRRPGSRKQVDPEPEKVMASVAEDEGVEGTSPPAPLRQPVSTNGSMSSRPVSRHIASIRPMCCGNGWSGVSQANWAHASGDWFAFR